jgi:hypothetical protein
VPSDICGASEFDRPSQENSIGRPKRSNHCHPVIFNGIFNLIGRRGKISIVAVAVNCIYIYIYISLIDLVCRRDSVIVSGHWLVKPVSK